MADVTNEIMTNDKTKILSGEFLNFYTPRRQRIRSFKVYFSPKQEGEGTPSPENIRPISGWTGVEVQHCGKNLLSDSIWEYGYYINANGIKKTSDLLKISDYLSLPQNTEYHFSGINNTNETITTSFHSYDENKQWLRRFAYFSIGPSKKYSFSITIPHDAMYIVISTASELIDAQLEFNSDETSYIPYKTNLSLPKEYQ